MLERAAGVSPKSSRVTDLMEEKKRAGKEIVTVLEEVWKAGRFPLDRTWKRRVRLAYCGWDEVDSKILKELFELARTRMLENDGLESSPLNHSIPRAIWAESKSCMSDCVSLAIDDC